MYFCGYLFVIHQLTVFSAYVAHARCQDHLEIWKCVAKLLITLSVIANQVVNFKTKLATLVPTKFVKKSFCSFAVCEGKTIF